MVLAKAPMVFDGEWQDDLRCGHGIMTASGDAYKGKWRNAVVASTIGSMEISMTENLKTMWNVAVACSSGPTVMCTKGNTKKTWSVVVVTWIGPTEMCTMGCGETIWSAAVVSTSGLMELSYDGEWNDMKCGRGTLTKSDGHVQSDIWNYDSLNA